MPVVTFGRVTRVVAGVLAVAILGMLPAAAEVLEASTTGTTPRATAAARAAVEFAPVPVILPSPEPGATPSDDPSQDVAVVAAVLPDAYAQLGVYAVAANASILRRAEYERQRAIRVAEYRRERAARLRAYKKRRAAALKRQAFIREHSCPVDRPRRYLNDYHPEPFLRRALTPDTDADGDGLEMRGHFGIDIFAPTGTPVRAPFDGVFRYSPSKAAGLAVKVYGGGGHIFIAHLSRYARLRDGARVKRADVIGYVGATGNARGTSPHAHIEWRPGNGPPASPWAFLNARCR